MVGANYMGGKRSAVRTRNRDTTSRTQKIFFKRQRLDVLTKRLSQTSKDGLPSTRREDISLGHARRLSQYEQEEDVDSVILGPSSPLRDQTSVISTGRSKVLEALDTSEPIGLRATLNRIIATPNLAGIPDDKCTIKQKPQQSAMKKRGHAHVGVAGEEDEPKQKRQNQQKSSPSVVSRSRESTTFAFSPSRSINTDHLSRRSTSPATSKRNLSMSSASHDGLNEQVGAILSRKESSSPHIFSDDMSTRVEYSGGSDGCCRDLSSPTCTLESFSLSPPRPEIYSDTPCDYRSGSPYFESGTFNGDSFKTRSAKGPLVVPGYSLYDYEDPFLVAGSLLGFPKAPSIANRPEDFAVPFPATPTDGQLASFESVPEGYGTASAFHFDSLDDEDSLLSQLNDATDSDETNTSTSHFDVLNDFAPDIPALDNNAYSASDFIINSAPVTPPHISKHLIHRLSASPSTPHQENAPHFARPLSAGDRQLPLIDYLSSSSNPPSPAERRPTPVIIQNPYKGSQMTGTNREDNFNVTQESPGARTSSPSTSGTFIHQTEVGDNVSTGTFQGDGEEQPGVDKTTARDADQHLCQPCPKTPLQTHIYAKGNSDPGRDSESSYICNVDEQTATILPNAAPPEATSSRSVSSSPKGKITPIGVPEHENRYPQLGQRPSAGDVVDCRSVQGYAEKTNPSMHTMALDLKDFEHESAHMSPVDDASGNQASVGCGSSFLEIARRAGAGAIKLFDDEDIDSD